jgi:hypothetical protein
MPEVKGKVKSKPKREDRPVLYPERYVEEADGIKAPALTAEVAMKLMGWVPESDGEKFGSDFLLTDEEGRKVRCTNNANNRPFDPSLARTWTGEILKRQWHYNGETIIVGRTGRVISGQHRLAGLVLARQIWEKGEDPRWKKIWKDAEPTMPALVVFGIDESDEVVNTVDTGKPRTAADAIYRSEVFAKSKPADRKALSRNLEFAIRTVWHRTGLKKNAFAPRRTHTDTFVFIERHPHIVAAVKHIYEEDKEGNVSKFVSPGCAAGLMYLFAASASDHAAWSKADPPTEKKADLTRWDKASDFWALFGKNPDFDPVRRVLGSLNAEDGSSMASQAEKDAVFCLAWNVYAANPKGFEFREEAITPEYVVDQEGVKSLSANVPTVGGLDLGNPNKSGLDDPEDEQPPTEEEVEARKTELEQEKIDKELERKRRAKGLAEILARRRATKEANSQAPPAAGDNGEPATSVAASE